MYAVFIVCVSHILCNVWVCLRARERVKERGRVKLDRQRKRELPRVCLLLLSSLSTSLPAVEVSV